MKLGSIYNLTVGKKYLIATSYKVRFIGVDGDTSYFEPLEDNCSHFKIHDFNGVGCWMFGVKVIEHTSVVEIIEDNVDDIDGMVTAIHTLIRKII